MQIELSQDFRKQVRKLTKPRRQEVARAIDAVQRSFGKPHLHAGLGLRRLRGNYFECRVGLQLRLILRAEPGAVCFIVIGNHDDVRKFIKGV